MCCTAAPQCRHILGLVPNPPAQIWSCSWCYYHSLYLIFEETDNRWGNRSKGRTGTRPNFHFKRKEGKLFCSISTLNGTTPDVASVLGLFHLSNYCSTNWPILKSYELKKVLMLSGLHSWPRQTKHRPLVAPVSCLFKWWEVTRRLKLSDRRLWRETPLFYLNFSAFPFPIAGCVIEIAALYLSCDFNLALSFTVGKRFNLSKLGSKTVHSN